ncbi:3-dehydroshikimate dehydratase [Uncinocarpus reesii 1704]|uniref:3-dehydroshikimate dehydratase n=1 Tax=Uncinocarpus reesii (strain UAMH 1704) TaxID=336963 RepID=C4JD72_UNCRE|nr:3-dehydroshikimate dehydratase [Uncinocarpus reesii 1704]EEP75431.1 3-dehydroshikimate dehydratase [Uncinocarpus reesii 1704]
MANRPAISSLSLGRAWVHELPVKLEQAANQGFQGIEIFYEDLEYLSRQLPGGLTRNNLLQGARQVRRICRSLNLKVIALQPFWFYEGLLDRAEHDRLLAEKLTLWFELGRILKTDTILIPSNFLPPDPQTGKPRITGDMDIIVGDLQQIADLGLKQSPPFRFAYESLAWGTYVNTWEKCWDIVCQVDRPNLGICLDTFNIAARVYADPSLPTGKTATADADIKATISRLIRRIDVRKVFFIQIVDGERLSAPLVEGHEWYVQEQPSRMSWSRNARLFAYEQDRGGYLPVVDIAKAIFDMGFEGWASLELFSRTLVDPDPKTPEKHAKRGIESWNKLVRDLQLRT